MRIPRELMIGDSLWKVRFVAKFDDEDTIGLCCPDIKEIWIKRNLTPKDRLETFFHEILHLIEDETGWNLHHKFIYKSQGPLAQIFLEIMTVNLPKVR